MSKIYSGDCGFLCEEGFARITRGGIADIYIVQNQEYPGNYKVSLAFYMDDFEPNNAYKIYGEPLVLREEDKIEFLGTAAEYFTPTAPFWLEGLLMVRMNPPDVGLLPTFRAIEQLKRKKVRATEQDQLKTISHFLEDYRLKRSLLDNSTPNWSSCGGVNPH